MTLNKEIIIQYFWESLRPSIRTHLDIRGRELDFWKEAIEKVVNVEVKAMLQLSSSIRNINSRCPQKNRPVKKEEKDFGKNKSITSPLADTLS